jgi:mxaD protein
MINFNEDSKIMKIKSAWLVGMSIFASGYALAAAPWLHATDTVSIDAPASKVWSTAKDFNGLANWHPALASDEIVSGTNNKVGAVRVLTLKGGGTIKEKLLAFDEKGRMFKYGIVESVLPFSNYTSTFVVKSAGKGKSTVTWSGHFKRKNTGDNPADGENDKAAVDTANSIYTGGLDNLKKTLEAK